MYPSKNTQSIEVLKGKKQLLISGVNFLLGKAVPKLEHEYLYCISMLEREAAIVQLHIALLSEEIRLREESISKNEMLSEEKLQSSLNNIRKEWEPKINKLAYNTNNDHMVFPDFVHEREYRLFLLNSTLENLNIKTSPSIKEYNTEFVRRITSAYREGNLGELRALRMIIESKQHLTDFKKNKFSIKTFFTAMKIRFRTLFSSSK